nr:hypothetical protein [Myxococcales bacterium]
GRGDPEDLDPALVELMSASSRQRHAKVLEQHHRNEVSGARWMLAGPGGLWAVPWVVSAMVLALLFLASPQEPRPEVEYEGWVKLWGRVVSSLVFMPVWWFFLRPVTTRTTLDGEALTLRSVLLGITLRTRRLPRSEIVGVRTVERWRRRGVEITTSKGKIVFVPVSDAHLETRKEVVAALRDGASSHRSVPETRRVAVTARAPASPATTLAPPDAPESAS